MTPVIGVLLLLLPLSGAALNELAELDFLQNYEIRRVFRAGSAHIDIYGKNMLAVSWLRDGEVSGYLFNTRDRGEKRYEKFAKRICPPYTVVDWGEGCPPGVLAAPCPSQWYWRDNITLTFGNDQFLTPIVDKLSIIRFDFVHAIIYGYHPSSGFIRRYDARTFNQFEPLYVGVIDDFHAGDGKVFISFGGNITVHDGRGRNTQIFKRPADQGEDVSVYYVYNSSCAQWTTSFSVYALAFIILTHSFYASWVIADTISDTQSQGMDRYNQTARNSTH
jgi:hypothetical protein